MAASISIITATYNSAETIRCCLESLRSQHICAEHILIDGGSLDETVPIAKSYSNTSIIISEPDRGIYDAINRGIALANGDVVGILNSDDFYSKQDVLSQVSEVFEDPAIDSCYGDLCYVDTDDTNRITRFWKAGSFAVDKFLWGWMPPHPTFFVRRSVYEKYGQFNLNLGSAADYELMLRFLVKYRISTTYIPEVLVRMRVGGISNASYVNRLKANRMDRKAWKVNKLRPHPWTTIVKPLRKIGQFVVRKEGHTVQCPQVTRPTSHVPS